MPIYEPMHQIGMWGENFKSNENSNALASMILEMDNKLDNQSEDASQGTLAYTNKYDQDASKPIDKSLRLPAQANETMVSLKLQKWLCARSLKCGRGKVMLDSKEPSEISIANSSMFTSPPFIFLSDCCSFETHLTHAI